MKLTVCASILAALAAVAGCRNGAPGPAAPARSEYEQLRGPDIARARELYRQGKTAEGAALLRELARDPDWSVRSTAIRAIGDVRDPQLLPVVHGALDDERLEVRESAGRILAWMGDASSREPLHRALGDREGIVRSHAAAALARIGGIDEIPALASLVQNDPDPTARASTVRVLGEIHAPAAVTVLIAALHDESAMVRGEAADALGASGDARARAALTAAAGSDPDPGVRERAGAALRRLDSHGTTDAP